MKRTLVITQPTYLPWLGYFEQMSRADVFVFLDSVQFERRSWQCRNRIRNARGETLWLTVPLRHQPRETAIRDILVTAEQPDWAATHLRLMTEHLRKAPFFETVLDVLRPIYASRPTHLAELNIAIVQAFAARLGLAPQFVRSSTLPVDGSKADLIVNLAKHLDATDYYSAAGSAEYLEAARGEFAKAGIAYSYQAWPHPQYSQGAGEFVSHLAVIDAVSWVGFERAAMLVNTPALVTAETSPHYVV